MFLERIRFLMQGSHFSEILYCVTYAHLCLGNPRKKCNPLGGDVHSEHPNHTFLTLFQASLNFCALILSIFAQNNSFPSCSCSLGTLPTPIHELCSPLTFAVFLMLEKKALGKGKERRTSEPLALEFCRKHSDGSFLLDGMVKRSIRPQTFM